MTDENDNAPVFEKQDYEATVNEVRDGDQGDQDGSGCKEDSEIVNTFALRMAETMEFWLS